MKQKYKLISKSIFFEKEKILAIADLHIGHEEAMNKAGVLLPRIQFKETMEDLKKIFFEISKLQNFEDHQESKKQRIPEIGKVNEIIICGDLKHEFSTISEQEWRETYKLIEYLKKYCNKIILVRGNHDKILGRMSEKIEIVDYYLLGDIVFLHGNRLFPEILDKNIKMLVMGHRHPAVTISDKYKKEKFKCFLVGKWKRKEIIILPSFFPLIEGSDLIEEGGNLLFIKEKDLRNFCVFVVGDRVYDFGKMRNIGVLG